MILIIYVGQNIEASCRDSSDMESVVLCIVKKMNQLLDIGIMIFVWKVEFNTQLENY